MAVPAKKEDARQEIATIAGGMPAFLDEDARASAGAGVSTDALDNIVPMVYVLQALSPQVDKENAGAYIAGAEKGMVWLRNSTIGVVREGGILFQPCHFQKVWPEWVPRDKGGGFVARHPNRSATEADVKRFGGRINVGDDIPDVEDADFKIDPKNRQPAWFRKNSGNDLRLTRNHAGFVVVGDFKLEEFKNGSGEVAGYVLRGGQVLPYVIPLTGSGHAVSRSWMFTMTSKHNSDGTITPSWFYGYRLTTRQRKNTQGTWYAFDVAEAGKDQKPVFFDLVGVRRGKALYEAFESGEKQAEAEVGGVAVEETASENVGQTMEKDNIPF